MRKLTIALLCTSLWACNTKDETPDTQDNSGQEVTKEEENGYDNDGTGDDIANSTFTKRIVLTFADNSVGVEGVADSVTIATDGADATINSQACEMEFVLKGKTSDGSVKIYSDKKLKISLEGAEIASAKGAAINIQTKKKTFVSIASGTTNSLSDAATYTNTPSGEDQKACLFSEGQLIFCGEGSLSVTGNCKHAICSDDYVTIGENVKISIPASAKDGIHANDYVSISGGETNITTSGSDCIDVDAGYFVMTSGTLTAKTTASAAKAVKCAGNMYLRGGKLSLSTSGAAEYDSEERDYKTAACLKSDSSIWISGGEVNATSTGAGGRAIKADFDITMDGGVVVATASGTSNNNYSAKGIKAEGDIVVNDGHLTVSSASHEGMESKKAITINGGIVEATASDDAINCAKALTVNDGYVYGKATGNDGIDSNSNIYINGGVVLGFGATDPECGIDALENCYIYVTGGVMVAVGGSNISYCKGSQGAKMFSGSLASFGVVDASGNTIVAWDYSDVNTNKSASVSWGPGGAGGPGGMGGNGSYCYIVSAPGIGNASKCITSATITGGTKFHGVTTDASVSGTSTATLSSATR